MKQYCNYKGELCLRQRDYKMDNLRLLFIFLVLLGHFMELIKGDFTSALYKIIYSFHMPAFLFLTGYFARFHRRKIVFGLIYPYILFQILYRIFDALIYKGKDTFTIEFGTPYWLLWYLLVTIFYYLLIPLLNTQNRTSQITIFIASIVLCILAGFDTSIGYYGSLARFFSFLPFFIAGFYIAQSKTILQFPTWFIFVLGIILVVASHYVITTPEITKNVLYGAYSYEKAQYNAGIKLFLLFLGFAWIAFLLHVIPRKKIPFISVLGQNTLAIFLLHGFIVRLAKKYQLFCFTELENVIYAVFFSIIIIFIFGNPWSAKCFQWLFTGQWIKTLLVKKRA